MKESDNPSAPVIPAEEQARGALFRTPLAGAVLWCGLLVLLGLLTANVRLLWSALERERGDSVERRFWVVCQPGRPASSRAEAFLALVGQGHAEWRSAKLNGLDLAGTDLVGRRLGDADLQGSTLRESILDAAVLTRARLGRCDLSGASLQRAELSGADLYRARLSGANLNQAVLRAAVCQEADFKGASLLVADLAEADLLMADCAGADLSGANLSGARLEATVLRDANLSLARLSGAKLKDADLTGANWWRARGMTSLDLARLTKDFPPGTNSPAQLRKDFEDWLAGGK